MTLDTRYFALAVRVVGIFVLAHAVPSFLFQLLSLLRVFDPTSLASVSASELFWAWMPTFTFEVIQLGIGMYLLKGGGALSRWCIRSCEFNCPRCGYDLESVKADRCPECGSRNVLVRAGAEIPTVESVH